MARSMKGFYWDVSIIGFVLVALAITMVLLSVMWGQFRPYYGNLFATNSTAYHTIVGLGDGFFYYSGDSILVFFYFMMILATFISAQYIGGGNQSITIVVGLAFLLIAIIVSFPISDFAHAFLANPTIKDTATYYQSTLYILDNLPTLTGILTLAYLIFVSTRKEGGYINSQGGSGGIVTGG